MTSCVWNVELILQIFSFSFAKMKRWSLLSFLRSDELSSISGYFDAKTLLDLNIGPKNVCQKAWCNCKSFHFGFEKTQNILFLVFLYKKLIVEICIFPVLKPCSTIVLKTDLSSIFCLYLCARDQVQYNGTFFLAVLVWIYVQPCWKLYLYQHT